MKRELEGVVHPDQEVHVVREADGGRNGDFIEPCGSCEDANKDFVELRSRAEQEASVDGAAGDLEEPAAFGDDA
jgi:hypothetical protein